MTEDPAGSRPSAAPPRFQPASDVLSGETADVYFDRARTVLAAEGLDPIVCMEIFARQDGILCGAREVSAYLHEVLGNGRQHDPEPIVESLSDGDAFDRKEVVMRITARYSSFGLYETAILGTLAQCSGWATAARRIVDAAAPTPVIGFGARHVHPAVADQMDYASVVGGCVGASTPAGARLAGLSPTGTMPHALILIFGDTVRAAEAFDRHIDPEVPRIVLVDTFKDEAEESLRVADALGERLWGVRLDTPSERGRVTADLVKEVRARLDLAGHRHVRIVVSGGLDVERIGYFKERDAPIDSFAVGSAISDASPIDFTGDLKEIDGRPIAKRGRIPGRTETGRLHRIELHGSRQEDATS
jgi:nicotinate phosphoribosyltransferase